MRTQCTKCKRVYGRTVSSCPECGGSTIDEFDLWIQGKTIREERNHMGQIKLVPVQNSNVLKVGYDAEEQRLQVLFKSGALYEYANVPKRMHTLMVKSGSIGRYIANNIVKGNKFEYKKIPVTGETPPKKAATKKAVPAKKPAAKKPAAKKKAPAKKKPAAKKNYSQKAC